MFFTFLKLYKWYQIAQHIKYDSSYIKIKILLLLRRKVLTKALLYVILVIICCCYGPRYDLSIFHWLFLATFNVLTDWFDLFMRFNILLDQAFHRLTLQLRDVQNLSFWKHLTSNLLLTANVKTNFKILLLTPIILPSNTDGI